MTQYTPDRAALRVGAAVLLAVAAAFFAAGVGVIPAVLYGQPEAGETAAEMAAETASDGPEAAVAPDALDAGAPPAQPIDFSHARHVGQAGIDCQFCHAYARRGPVAGIPSVQRCAGCHQAILSEAPEILKVLDYWENRQPIPWVRVHNLPDHVRFNHKAHIRAGFDCAECHGDVGAMTIARQVSSLTMGWCVDCHQTNNASRDCLICHH